MSPPLWDVAVVGAGPAGAAAALAVLHTWPGARVLMLDRSDFPRDKTCGDGVAPHTLDVLAEVGCSDLLADLPTVDRYAMGYPQGPWVEHQVRAGHVVPRLELDARLVRAAQQRGAVLRRMRVRALSRCGPDRIPLLQLTGDDPAARRTPADHRDPPPVLARVVIGADGAASVLRRAAGLGAQRRGTVAVALRGYAPVQPGGERAQVISFLPGARHWPAYAWSFPIGDGRANVGYGELIPAGRPGPTRAELADRLELLLPGAGAQAGSWRGAQLPLATGRARQPDGPLLLAGDALGLVNPITGEGIYHAVLSGVLAGRAAAHAARAGHPGQAGGLYRRTLSRRLHRHWATVGLGARLAGRDWLLAGTVSASRRDARVFDDLVEIGLGTGAVTPRLTGALVTGLARRAGRRLPVPGR